MSVQDERKHLRIQLYDPDDVKLTIRHSGGEWTGVVFNYSRFGLGIILDTEQEAQNGDALSSVSIEAFGETRDLGEGQVAWTRREEDRFLVGLSLEREFIDMEFLLKESRLLMQEDELKSINYYFEYQDKADPKIKELAVKWAFGLGLYKKSLDELDWKFRDESDLLKEQLFEALSRGLGLKLSSFMDESLKELEGAIADFGKRDHEINGFYLRRTLWPYLMDSKFLKRTIIKPRGYAGDSAMMEMCYANEYVGSSSFGKFLHKHPLDTPAAEAVRFRRGMINERLNDYIEERELPEGEKIKVMSVACGPAWEMQDFFRDSEHRRRIRLALLDQDDEALGEARRNIDKVSGGEPFDIEFLRDSVRVLLRTAKPGEKYGEFDFIYSMGLFDYLTAPVARAVLSKLYSLTAPGGMLIVGNYHEQTPTRIYLDYLMDWPLIYRNEKNFLALTDKFAGNFHAKTEIEPSGSQMFLIVRKD